MGVVRSNMGCVTAARGFTAVLVGVAEEVAAGAVAALEAVTLELPVALGGLVPPFTPILR
jgi:hypothetical protein